MNKAWMKCMHIPFIENRSIETVSNVQKALLTLAFQDYSKNFLVEFKRRLTVYRIEETILVSFEFTTICKL